VDGVSARNIELEQCKDSLNNLIKKNKFNLFQNWKTTKSIKGYVRIEICIESIS
jgi:hypothetical protein